MSPFSPLFDASAAGAIAQATLAAPSLVLPAPTDHAFPTRVEIVAASAEKTARSGWLGWLDAAVSLVSGPEPVRPHV